LGSTAEVKVAYFADTRDNLGCGIRRRGRCSNRLGNGPASDLALAAETRRPRRIRQGLVTRVSVLTRSAAEGIRTLNLLIRRSRRRLFPSSEVSAGSGVNCWQLAMVARRWVTLGSATSRHGSLWASTPPFTNGEPAQCDRHPRRVSTAWALSICSTSLGLNGMQSKTRRTPLLRPCQRRHRIAVPRMPLF
jgi:hypothetical protein